MEYCPGLHILAEFSTVNTRLLSSAAGCQTLFSDIVLHFELQQIGAIYHDFPGGGFTAVVCLTESHLSIHTWPEFGIATFDVFLSNYRKDNSEKVRSIYARVLRFFEGIEISKKELTR